ncbi:MAG: flagellar protein FlaG [Brevundimonas sp.]
MQGNANIGGITAHDVTSIPVAANGDFRDSRAQQEADQAARYRLVIEEGPKSGSFIYKTMDRLTGEIVKQFPREQVVDLMRSADYSAGAVIDTRA